MVFDYWRSIFRRARKETTLFARNKLTIGAIIAALGFIFQGAFGLRPWMDLGKIVFTVVVSYLIVVICAYVYKVVVLPSAVDEEKNSSIRAMKEEAKTLNELLEETEKPKIDPAEQTLRSEVQAELDKLDPLERSVLRQIAINDGRLFAGEPLKRLAVKKDIESEKLINTLNSLARSILLNYEQKTGEVWWEIPAGYRDAIRKLL